MRTLRSELKRVLPTLTQRGKRELKGEGALEEAARLVEQGYEVVEHVRPTKADGFIPERRITLVKGKPPKGSVNVKKGKGKVCLQLKFWHNGYNPRDCFQQVRDDFQVSQDGGGTWRKPKPGQTLTDLGWWMSDHNIHVKKVKKIEEKNRSAGWWGLYVLTLSARVLVESYEVVGPLGLMEQNVENVHISGEGMGEDISPWRVYS